MSPDGELCVDDPTRVGLPMDEDGVSFSVDFEVRYKQTDGVHMIDELKDGTKDGKSYYKKIVPAPVRLFLPKFDHVTITPEIENAALIIKAQMDDAILPGLTVEEFHGSYVVDVDELENLGADRLVIQGGAYYMEPTPSIKAMKKFMRGDEDKE